MKAVWLCIGLAACVCVVYVRFHALMLAHGEGEEMHCTVSTGVILKGGQELGVARMGDKTLMVNASYLE